MTCLIISGGDFSPLPSLEYDFVIACDRGYLHAQRMEITPDLIMGDFDSAPVPDDSIPVEQFPSHKDDTDTMLALKKAISLGYTDIHIACAFGGRLDHSIANLQAAAYAAEQGTIVHLHGADMDAWAFQDKSVPFPKRDNYALSVFSLSDESIISISGAEYEANNLLIWNNYPIGISNSWAAGEVTVTAKKGTIMVMECQISS